MRYGGLSKEVIWVNEGKRQFWEMVLPRDPETLMHLCVRVRRVGFPTVGDGCSKHGEEAEVPWC